MAIAKSNTKSGSVAAPANAPAKKAKTGGRVIKSIEEKIADAIRRSTIAALHDDTTLDSELAALYLGMSEAKLGELRSPLNKAKGSEAAGGPPMIKVFDKGAVGQNQPVQYKLGVLREFQLKNTVSDSFAAAVGAGLAGWVTMRIPFFAELEKRSDRGRQILLGAAWDLVADNREERFKELVEKKIRLVMMSSAEAASSRWNDLTAHKKWSKPWLALLKDEARAVKAAMEGTEISVVTKHAVERDDRKVGH